MQMAEIAASFVDLALKHDWRQITELPADELQIIFEIVSAAGFEPTQVVPGKLVGNYLDQDGSRTGDTYPINSSCPYKILGRNGNDHYRATGWLDCALSLARRGVSREERVQAIQREIERSIPLEPIKLNVEGDTLREYPSSSYHYFVDHTRDSQELGGCIGVHDYCNGFMDRSGATKTHDAIVCRRCHLRILFPKEVKTYGELRMALASKVVQVTA
jgi:hypothetical protein